MAATENDITLFAKTNFRNKQVPFGIKREDRRKHMYVIGKTGMGKTTMMENMIIQDIINGNGVAFIDPHGDSVEKILNFIPSNRVNDVVYINPSDMDFPIAFNILESVDSSYKHLVASGLMGVFTKIWAGTWSARMEYILSNCILALLDSPGNTLLGISRMLIDKKYRKKIVDSVKDPMVRSFWTDEYANWQEKYRQEAVAPIQNKVGQFLSTGLIRNIVGQSKSTIDLRQMMDEKKILLVNLSKGRVGEDNSALLGAMIITKLQLAALSRVDIPEEERNDFYLYVDEFQNFATESFATILSEARKYRLNLIVGHQYIGQLVNEKNTKVRDAVFGNVGTIITFRIGAADAEYLEKEFAPIFTENDLVNIPKHTVVLRLMINGVASDPFTAETLPPGTYPVTGNAEKVVRVSRERYANPITEVEQKISKWMGQDYHEQAAVIASHMNDPMEQDESVPEVVPAKVVTVEAEKVVVERPAPEPKATQLEVRKETPKEPEFKFQEMEMEMVPERPAPKVDYRPQQDRRAPSDRRDSRKNDRRHEQRRGNKKPATNPIWDTVAKMTSEKVKESQAKSKEILNKIAEPKEEVAQPKPNPQASHNQENERTILQPGQKAKFNG